MDGDAIDVRMFARSAGANVSYGPDSVVVPSFALSITEAGPRRIRGIGPAM